MNRGLPFLFATAVIIAMPIASGCAGLDALIAPPLSVQQPVSWSGRCRSPQLDLRQGQPIGEATQQRSRVEVLVNTSRRGCVLDGYPTVRLTSRNGAALPFRISDSGDQMVTDRRPRPVPLRPGDRAFFMVNTIGCVSSLGRLSYTLEVTLAETLPADLLRDRTKPPLTLCGTGERRSVLDVSPFGPSLRYVSAH